MEPSDRVLSMMTASAVRSVQVLRVSGADVSSRADALAAEEPLELIVNGDPFAIVMRTPGADRELAAGFLLAEQVIRNRGDLVDVRRDPASGHRLEVQLGEAASARLAAMLDTRRRVTTTSACGLCGRVAIESLQAVAAPIAGEWTIPAARVATCLAALGEAQAVFAETGGLHAAGLFDAEGRLVLAAEDVGRHNAVDKVIGRALVDGRLPLDEALLVVSGRASFELVQKALLAGIPMLIAVSAPSSLAVELATDVGITLIGFARRDGFNVYSGRWRVRA